MVLQTPTLLLLFLFAINLGAVKGKQAKQGSEFKKPWKG